MQRHALDERYELVASLRAAGPEAPTLCGRWRTGELATHLLLRERSLREALGRLPIRRWHQRAEDNIDTQLARRGYDAVVTEFAAGPPRWSPWALPPVAEAVNLVEYTVHHEDVRRAGPEWSARRLALARQRALWSRLRLAAPVTLRGLQVGLELTWPGHGSIVTRRAKHGDPVVTVTGDPVELTLLAFGRQRVAEVQFEGRVDDVSTVRAARIAV